MRIDQLLVQRQLASTRSQAQRLLGGGVEWLQGDAWRRVVKNGDEVPDDALVRLLDDSEARYVSRGGLKLEAALKHVGLSVEGLQCLDIGQSTGGFTDCLLQAGAALVVGVDVGSAQLHPSLRQHPRVLCLEGVNARTLDAADLIAAYEDCSRATGELGTENATAQVMDEFHQVGRVSASVTRHLPHSVVGLRLRLTRPTAGAEQLPQDRATDVEPAAPGFVPEFDLLVADLAFISQTLVLPAVVPLLKPGGYLLTLVKPQFELQPGQVGKGGIVRDDAMYPLVEQRLRETCAALGLTVTAWFDSSVAGGDGNREFFIAASKPQL